MVFKSWPRRLAARVHMRPLAGQDMKPGASAVGSILWRAFPGLEDESDEPVERGVQTQEGRSC